MVSKTESPVHDLSQEGRALQKGNVLQNLLHFKKKFIKFINLRIIIYIVNYYLLCYCNRILLF